MTDQPKYAKCKLDVHNLTVYKKAEYKRGIVTLVFVFLFEFNVICSLLNLVVSVMRDFRDEEDSGLSSLLLPWVLLVKLPVLSYF